MSNTQAETGALYIVATPIGNFGDIGLRAIETLKAVDFILAEDTRESHKLLQHYNITKPMFAFHEHNEKDKTVRILEEIRAGKSIALISDAGTPLINDPGFHLVRELKLLNLPVIPIPGPSALIAALSASGLPSDSFSFMGFLPSKKNARRKLLENLKRDTCTLIFYEAPHRLQQTLEDLAEIFGSDREAVLARELTKKFETIKLSTLSLLLEFVKSDQNQQRGECVLLISGYETKTPKREAGGNLSELEGAGEEEIIEKETLKILKILLAELPMTQAASIASKITGIPKRILYNKALDLQ